MKKIKTNKVTNKALQTFALACAGVAISSSVLTGCTDNPALVYAWTQLSNINSSFGLRKAGTADEKNAANHITNEWQQMGFSVQQMPFSFPSQQNATSSNLMVEIQGASPKVLIVGAHYDAAGGDSLGATDNASGVATLLALSKELKNESLPYTVRFIAFGAEEVGLFGSKEYVNTQPLNDVVGMVNLDTVIGGDRLYVHSATTGSAYACAGIDSPTYNSDDRLRTKILAVSENLYGADAHKIHPAFPGYPEGETGDWSDHSPFACKNIPIAYVEATNFAINGKNGYDGYSQTTNPKFWDCFDAQNNTACNRDTETQWGQIWHTKNDRLDILESTDKEKLGMQLSKNIEVLKTFMLEANGL